MEALHIGRNVTLIAPRRMGKTGLICHAFYHLKEIIDYLGSSEKRCYIAIDEFQQIAEYPKKGVKG